MKKYLSPFICGFGAGVLQVVPVAKAFSFWLIIPIAAYFALNLDQRANKDFSKILPGKAIIFGLLTGLYAALFGSFFDVLITFIVKNNYIVTFYPHLSEMISDMPFQIDEQMKKELIALFTMMRDQILDTGFSFAYSIYILVGNLILDSIFGMIGGLLGRQIINRRNQKAIS